MSIVMGSNFSFVTRMGLNLFFTIVLFSFFFFGLQTNLLVFSFFPKTIYFKIVSNQRK